MSDQLKTFYVQVGEEACFERTVSESDVYLFAGITGDFSPNHVNEAAMRRSKFGRRLVHGALLVGFMSAASTMAAERLSRSSMDKTPVSLGYDRVRFLAPVFLGETIKVTYRIVKIDVDRDRAYADVTVAKEDGTPAAVAQHILKWTPNPRIGQEATPA